MSANCQPAQSIGKCCEPKNFVAFLLWSHYRRLPSRAGNVVGPINTDLVVYLCAYSCPLWVKRAVLNFARGVAHCTIAAEHVTAIRRKLAALIRRGNQTFCVASMLADRTSRHFEVQVGMSALHPKSGHWPMQSKTSSETWRRLLPVWPKPKIRAPSQLSRSKWSSTSALPRWALISVKPCSV